MQPEIKNILEKNSQRIITKISAAEVTEIKNAITEFVSEIEAEQSREIVDQLLSLQFGAVKNNILHLAAKFSGEAEVKKILELTQNPSYVNSRNDELFAALHFAAINGTMEMIEILINSGADKNPQTSEQKRKWSPIHYAAKYGNLEIVAALIEFGVDKETKTAFGLTPLLVAVEFGHAKIVEFLLSIGARCDVQTSEDNQKMTALHYAAIGNYLDVATILLLAKIDKEKETTFGLTALEFAAKNNLVEMTSLLIEWGSSKWENALKIALSNDSKDTVQLIKDYQKARDDLFNLKFLNESAAELLKLIQGYDANSLSEPRIIFSERVKFNAYGILPLKHQFGFFFKKTTKTLPQFLSENGFSELSAAIKKLETF